MEITIKHARIEDADAIAVMLRQLASDIGDCDSFRSDADTIRRHGFGEQPLFQCLIAEGLGENLGLVLFFPLFSTTRGKPGVYVQDLWIAGSARGQGLGTRLLAAVAEYAASQWQAAYMGLTVYADNATAAAFYRQLGFHGNERDLPVALDGPAFEKLRDQV